MEQINSKPITQELSKEQFEQIFDCLSKLADKVHVVTVMLVNQSGRILAQRNEKPLPVDPTTLAGLVAGSYAAGMELSRLLKEKDNFKMVLHEGHDHNVLISTIGEEYFLLIVFETSVALGMIRLFLKRTSQVLLPILNQKIEKHDMQGLFDDRFQTLLGDELDRTLKESF